MVLPGIVADLSQFFLNLETVFHTEVVFLDVTMGHMTPKLESKQELVISTYIYVYLYIIYYTNI